MKKILMLLFVAASIVVSSCSKNDYVVYENIPATLYISNSGVIEAADLAATYDINIAKGGNAEYTVTATLEKATQVIVNYNIQNNANYAPLPAECYSLSVESFSLAASEGGSSIAVTFDAMAIDALPAGDYALALVVESDNAYINKDKDYVMFCIER
jgi:hypothetical protein